jgi:hypothetical protein
MSYSACHPIGFAVLLVRRLLAWSLCVCVYVCAEAMLADVLNGMEEMQAALNDVHLW